MPDIVKRALVTKGFGGKRRSISLCRISSAASSGLYASTRFSNREGASTQSRHLLKRRRGRPSTQVERHYANFTYQAKSWSKPRRVVAKVEWHSGELFPRVGFVVTTLTVRDERVFEFYNRRGTAEQYIKEGKYALKWTRLSCKSFKANEVRLQLHALAYNLGNFLRTLVLPTAIADWSLTSLRDRMIKIGAKAVRHARSTILQLAEIAVPRDLWAQMLTTISGLKAMAQAP